MKSLLTYFPDLTDKQQQQFAQLGDVYREWNEKINVISRKDIDELYERHVLHSLAIALFNPFKPGAYVLDIGTGGGFPGVPLAILFPDVQFTLADSIGKKITVVNGVKEALGLQNIRALHSRAENVDGVFDFVVSRAVAPLLELYQWCGSKILKNGNHDLDNGLICLKGGDLAAEIKEFRFRYKSYKVKEKDIADYFPLPFFETKKIVYVHK